MCAVIDGNQKKALVCYQKQETQREEIRGEPNEQYKISENASSDEVNKTHLTVEGYFCQCYKWYWGLTELS